MSYDLEHFVVEIVAEKPVLDEISMLVNFLWYINTNILYLSKTLFMFQTGCDEGLSQRARSGSGASKNSGLLP